MAEPSQSPAPQAVPAAPQPDQDQQMTDAPVPSSTPTAQRTTTPSSTPARTNTPKGSSAIAPPPAQAAAPAPTKAMPNGARCRQYLNEKVTAVLLDGMKKLASEQPEDPLRVLGEFLLAKSKELEGS